MNDGSQQTETLYVWLAKDLDGVEGIIAIPMGSGYSPLPLIATDRALAECFAAMAAQAARARDQTARLVTFTRGDVLREVT